MLRPDPKPITRLPDQVIDPNSGRTRKVGHKTFIPKTMFDGHFTGTNLIICRLFLAGLGCLVLLLTVTVIYLELKSNFFPSTVDTTAATISAPAVELATRDSPPTEIQLHEVAMELSRGGFAAAALSMEDHFSELSKLKTMTVFALSDVSVSGKAAYNFLMHFSYHVVPNLRLTSRDLLKLQPGTVLLTMEMGSQLVVTTGGGAGDPFSINNANIASLELVNNSRIVVHAILSPFVPTEASTAANEAAATSIPTTPNHRRHLTGRRSPAGIISMRTSLANSLAPDAVKQIQEYIKFHNLQNPAYKREIFREHKLIKSLFEGRDKVGIGMLQNPGNKHGRTQV